MYVLTWLYYLQIENPQYVEKILDIQVDQLCYMIGTIYLEMPAKPNVMKNLQDEVSLYVYGIIHY